MSEICKRLILHYEVEQGILYIPLELRSDLPVHDGKILIRYGDFEVLSDYNSFYNRLSGLSNFYHCTELEIGDILEMYVQDDALLISYHCDYEVEEVDVEDIKEEEEQQQMEAEQEDEVFDLSGISNITKGDVMEDRVKEYILLNSQGLLTIFKPVIDNNGIDLIVMRRGVYHPVYLQVKSRFNVYNTGVMELSISKKTFTTNDNFFVVGVSFNKDAMDVDDKILFVPSEFVEEHGTLLDGQIQITVPYTEDCESVWSPYFIKKSQLAGKIIEYSTGK